LTASVYIMECRRPRLVTKIGHSQDSEARRLRLQCDTGSKVERLCEFKMQSVGHARQVERYLHGQFRDNRFPGTEWFDIHPMKAWNAAVAWSVFSTLNKLYFHLEYKTRGRESWTTFDLLQNTFSAVELVPYWERVIFSKWRFKAMNFIVEKLGRAVH